MKAILGGSVFLMLYFIALLKPFFPYVEYYAKQDYFIEVLCSNKNKPELLCFGKCALDQKLKSAADESNAQSANYPKLNLGDYPIGFISFIHLPLISLHAISKLSESQYLDSISDRPITHFFHPPPILL